jgi:cation transport ATPase
LVRERPSTTNHDDIAQLIARLFQRTQSPMSIAHRKRAADLLDVSLGEIAVGDTLVIYPHEICPADGVVVEGHGVMDES